MDLEELYDKLYRYCYMKTNHPQTAEDLTQEAFLRFLRTRDVSEIKKQTAYLYTIARNLCIDFYRTKGLSAGAGGGLCLRGQGRSAHRPHCSGAGPGTAAGGGPGPDLFAVHQRGPRSSGGKDPWPVPLCRLPPGKENFKNTANSFCEKCNSLHFDKSLDSPFSKGNRV